MSRLFSRLQSLQRNSAIITGYPYTISAWVNDSGTETVFPFIVSYWTNGFIAAGTRLQLYLDNTGLVSAGVGAVGVSATAARTVNTWFHACAVHASATSHAAFLNGGNKGTSTSSATFPTGMNRTSINSWNNNTNVGIAGSIAHVCIWNAALTDSEVSSLANGISPLKIRANLIAAYYPLTGGNLATEIDVVNGYDLTNYGSTFGASEPRIFLPNKQSIPRAFPTFAAQPAAPIVTSTPTGTSTISLTASGTAVSGSTILNFNSQYSTNETDWSTVTSFNSTYEYQGLTPNTTYYFRVRFNQTNGQVSPWAYTNAKTAAIVDDNAVPAAPTLIAVSNLPNTIEVTINATPNTGLTVGSNSYDLQRLNESSVTSNVEFSFDPENVASYPGFGTILTDLIGNNTGTLNGGITFDSTNKVFNLDGVNGYISTSKQYTNPQLFSVGTWFKTAATAGKKIIGFTSIQTGQEITSYDRHLYIGTDGKLYFGVYNPTQAHLTVSSSTVVNDNVWHYATGTLNSSGVMKLYLDGIFVGQRSTLGAENYSGYWRIGAYQYGGWPNTSSSSYPYPSVGYLSGSIGATHLYNKELSAEEVAQNYNSFVETKKSNASILTGPWTSIATTATFQDINKTALRKYFYRARFTQSNNKTSPYSVPVSTTVLGISVPVVAPTVALTVLGTTSIGITVTAQPTINQTVTSYAIEKSLDGTTWNQISSGLSNTYTDTGLTASTTYYYRAKFTQTDGRTSPYSTVSGATTSAISTLGAPTVDLTPISKSEMFADVIVPAIPSGQTVTAYSIERSTTSSGPWTIVGTGSAIMDSGLATNTAYYYRAKYTTNAGESGYSTVVNSSTFNPVALPDQTLRDAGYILVTDYGADPTGVTDSTTAIQNAINAGGQQRKPVWVKTGTYLISNTLRCYSWHLYYMGGSPDGQRNALIGSHSGAARPKFKIAANAAAFSNVNLPRPMVTFMNLWHNYKAENNAIPADALTFYPFGKPATGSWEYAHGNLYDAVFCNIDLDTNGNVGAVGLHINACQDSIVNNVKVTATGSLCAFWHLPNAGSPTINIEAEGGQYGVRFDNAPVAFRLESGSGVCIIGLKLYNQTVQSILTSDYTPLAIVGFDIRPAAGGVAWSNLADYGTDVFSLIDGRVTQASGTAFNNVYGRSIYLKNVYFSGTNNLTKYKARSTITATGTWKRIVEYCSVSSKGAYPYDRRQYDSNLHHYSIINNVLTSGNDNPESVVNVESNASEPPSDLLSRHYPEQFFIIDNGPYVEVQGTPVALSTMTLVGDVSVYSGGSWASSANHTQAIQSAIDQAEAAGHGRVFLRTGAWYINSPLVLKKKTKLFGTCYNRSRIAALASWVPTTGYVFMMTTENYKNATTSLSHLTVDTPRERGTLISDAILGQQYTGDRFSAVQWRAGRYSLMGHFKAHAEYWDETKIRHPINYFYMTDNAGGRFYGLGEDGRNNSGRKYRAIRCEGTTEPMHFYDVNVEAGKGTPATGSPETNIEITNCKNIRLYGGKREGDSATIVVTDCDNIAYYSCGGAMLTPMRTGEAPYSHIYVKGSSANIVFTLSQPQQAVDYIGFNIVDKSLPALIGTVTVNGTTVTGTGTAFSTALSAGALGTVIESNGSTTNVRFNNSLIDIGGSIREVVSITNNNVLSVNSAFTGLTASPYTAYPITGLKHTQVLALYKKGTPDDSKMKLDYFESVVQPPTPGSMLEYDASNLLSYSGSGTVVKDLNSEYNNATIVNGVSYSSDKTGIFVFNGIDGHIQSSRSFNDPESFSIDIWFSTTSNLGRKIIGFENTNTPTGSTNYDRMLYVGTDGKLYFGTYDGVQRVVFTTEIITDGAWYNAVATYNTGQLKLYVNGVLVSSGTSNLAQTYTGYWKIGGYAAIGWPSISTNGFFSGKIGPVEVYTRELTGAEILSNYNASKNLKFLRPVSPITLLTVLSSTSIKIDISAIPTTGYTASSYIIDRSLDGVTWQQIHSAASTSSTYSYTDTSLSAGTTYYYRSRFSQTNGETSKNSLVVSATTTADIVGGSLVLSGLLFSLDLGDTTSYSGTGTTITDVS